MAEIFAFPKTSAGKRPHARPATAEVVIFPGIRVEYHDEPPAPTGTRKPRKSRRTPAGTAASA